MIAAIASTIKMICYGRHVPVFWSKTSNWGDSLNPYLVSRMAGIPVRFDANPACRKYQVIGSILHHADANTSVWGTGLMSPKHLPTKSPRKIFAVRGPHTRAELEKAGFKCPAVYGDPALLLPRYYRPEVDVRFSLGIVPHYTDSDHPAVKRLALEESVLIIDVKQGVESFVKQVSSCRAIGSSSLHGLICADAYGIPSRWLLFGEGVTGEGFKFNDYYAAHGMGMTKPLVVTDSVAAGDIIAAVKRIESNLDLDKLISVCPFRKRGVQAAKKH